MIPTQPYFAATTIIINTPLSDTVYSYADSLFQVNSPIRHLPNPIDHHQLNDGKRKAAEARIDGTTATTTARQINGNDVVRRQPVVGFQQTEGLQKEKEHEQVRLEDRFRVSLGIN